ncbi:MAG: class I SAM-dependent methyltransferase [Deltaproteobacteria bacterium]|nr:class I SAM-dependent methyltransferase [Deltaproteobacteria bacterium]
MQKTAGEFWGELAVEYDDIIRRLVSPYPAMVWALLNYLPEGFVPKRILEFGCGTGNLTAVLRRRWPDSAIVVVDAAESMLAKTKERIGELGLELVNSRFEDLAFGSNEFDYITSSLSLHHLSQEQFQILLRKSHSWLKPGGFFGLLDCVRAESDRLYKRAENHWIDLAKKHGLSDKEMAEQIAHHKAHDHYPILIDLPQWFRESAYEEVDILWRYCIWAVLQARKPVKVG